MGQSQQSSKPSSTAPSNAARAAGAPAKPGEAKPGGAAPAASGSNRSGLSSTAELRERARRDLGDGAVTSAYGADREVVIDLLNRSLATELVCALRYKRHAATAQGLSAEPIAEEFAAHALDELGHADRIAARISQLGGDPDFSPVGLVERSHAEYDASKDLVDMIRADLVAERIAIDAYGEAIRFIGLGDPTTRKLLEEILALEEEHANDMSGLLARHGSK